MFKAYWPSFVFTAAMISTAIAMLPFGGGSPFRVTGAYLATGAGITLLACLIWVFVHVVKSARAKRDEPLRLAWQDLRPRLPLLIMPAVLFPLFYGGFTTVKTNLATFAGFRFDRLFASWDVMIFGQDPWRITHAFLGPQETYFLQFLYITVWVSAVAYTKALLPLFASERRCSTFYNAMTATWFIGGTVIAYALSSAGPVFAEMVDPEFAARFAPMKANLAHWLHPNDAWNAVPKRFMREVPALDVSMGKGISAMPSMHIATVTIFILAAKGTRWFWPAVIFAVLIFVGSVHGGMHYVVDALAAPLAYLCWKAAAKWSEYVEDTRSEAKVAYA